MTVIEDVFFRKILDSRGNPTVEVDVVTTDSFGRAAAPSGASTGAHEVRAWPEGGVDAAVEVGLDKIATELEGAEVFLQQEIDGLLEDLDGTKDFANLGGNTCVAVSLAVAKAAAASLDIPLYAYLGGTFIRELPRPLGNVLGGGAHAVGGTDFQEYMAVALGPTVEESVFANAAVHARVKKLLKEKLPGHAIGKGDEGAWVAPLDNVAALRLVAQACDEVSSEVDFEVRVALDVAATEFYEDGYYHYKDGKKSSEEQVEFLAGLVEEFDIFSVEDGLAEDDWDAWAALTKRVGDRALLVGDDLFTTNPDRLAKGIEAQSANAILVKPNQIGTLTRTVDTIKLAHDNGFKSIISHRSGETTDTTIAHIGAAFGCMGIKTGAVGGERTAKLNELIRIEEQL